MGTTPADFGFYPIDEDDGQMAARPSTPADFGFYPAEDNEKSFWEQGGSQPSPMGFSEKLPRNVAAGAGQFGHSLLNAPHTLASLVSQNLAEKIPQYRPGFDYSEAVGVPGTEGDKFIQALTRLAPSALVPGLPLGGGAVAAALGRIGSQGLYGLATGEEKPIENAATMAAGQGIAEALPLPFKFGGAVADAIRPQKQMANLLEQLGGGQTIGENSRIIADKIKENYKNSKQLGEKLYGSVFDRARNLGMETGELGRKSAHGKLESRPEISPETVHSFERHLGELYKTYEREPSLDNAHKLQSSLGTEIRHMQQLSKRGNFSLADRKVLNEYKHAQKSIKDYISDHLKAIDEKAGLPQDQGLLEEYKGATKHWRENVIPYQSNQNLFKIAEGRIKNPRNIGNIFKNPESWTERVVQDLGPEGMDKILYSQLGKFGPTKSPESLSSAFEKLSEQGFEDYITPKLLNEIDTLNKRIKARDLAQTLGLGSLFGSVAKNLGIGNLGEASSAVLGGYAAKPYLKAALEGKGGQFGARSASKPKQDKNKPIVEALKKFYKKSYAPTVRAGVEYLNED